MDALERCGVCGRIDDDAEVKRRRADVVNAKRRAARWQAKAEDARRQLRGRAGL